MTNQIQDFVKSQKRFPDFFTLDNSGFTMTHYDQDGKELRYEDQNGVEYAVLTPDNRYNAQGYLNMQCFDTLTVELI
jgi:hypothetical protein